MAYQSGKIREFKYILPDNTDVSLLGALRYGIDLRAELRVPKSSRAESAVMHIHSDGYEGDIKKVEIPLELDSSGDEYDVFSIIFNTGELTDQLVDVPYGLFYYEYTVKVAAGTLHLGGEEPTELLDAWENSRYRSISVLQCITKNVPCSCRPSGNQH